MSHTSSNFVITVLALLMADMDYDWLPYNHVLASGVYQWLTLLLYVKVRRLDIYYHALQ